MPNAYPAAVIGIDYKESLYQLGKKKEVCSWILKFVSGTWSFGERAMGKSAYELVRSWWYRNLSSAVYHKGIATVHAF